MAFAVLRLLGRRRSPPALSTVVALSVIMVCASYLTGVGFLPSGGFPLVFAPLALGRPAGTDQRFRRGQGDWLPGIGGQRHPGANVVTVSPAGGLFRRHQGRGRLIALSESLARNSQQRRPSTLDVLNDALDSGLGSMLLLLVAGISMLLANWRCSSSVWLGFWATACGPAIGAHSLVLRDWVNEGLMCLFFFYVGLEIKKEITEGSLSSPRQALLPCIAACGGMVVPMLVYLAVNLVLPGGSLEGITIPMATDIAFALGIYGLFRRRMPQTAEPFLLTLATVDDLGAILVIAVCFAGHLSAKYLAGAAASLAAAIALGRWAKQHTAGGIFVPGLALWYCLLRGGINADIAGFLCGLCVPMRTAAGDEVVHRLAKRWAPACGLIILPIFALANCAVPFGGGGSATGATSLAVPLGVGLGLLLGKPLGILGFSGLAVRLGLSPMPAGMSYRHLGIIGVLGSMGFTMCLFLIQNSLVGRTAEITKVFMLLASIAGAVLGAALMRTYPIRPAKGVPSDEHVEQGHQGVVA